MLHTFQLGDWICKTCALECGIRTGIEGHEWEFKRSPGGSKDCKYPAVAGNTDPDLQSSNEDSDSDESVQQKPQKRMRTNTNRFFESDSDEDEDEEYNDDGDGEALA